MPVALRQKQVRKYYKFHSRREERPKRLSLLRFQWLANNSDIPGLYAHVALRVPQTFRGPGLFRAPACPSLVTLPAFTFQTEIVRATRLSLFPIS